MKSPSTIYYSVILFSFFPSPLPPLPHKEQYWQLPRTLSFSLFFSHIHTYSFSTSLIYIHHVAALHHGLQSIDDRGKSRYCYSQLFKEESPHINTHSHSTTLDARLYR